MAMAMLWLCYGYVMASKSFDFNKQIKLMRTVGNPQKFISRLNQEEIKKVFPDDYYDKYANHIKILQFEKQLITDSGKKTDIVKFIKRKLDQVGECQKKRNKLNRYDPPEDAIEKNRQQCDRMHKFVRNIDKKLKHGTIKESNTIRNPLNGYSPIDEEVFDKMRQIDDQQYVRRFAKKQMKKKKEEEYVQFERREKAKSMQTSSLASLREVSVRNMKSVDKNSSLHGYNLTLQPPPMMEFEQAAIMTQRKNPYRQYLSIVDTTALVNSKINPQHPRSSLQYIMNINSALKKISKVNKEMEKSKMMANNSSLMYARQLSKSSARVHKNPASLQRKDLITETKKIKQVGEKIQILSRYENLMKTRSLKKLIMMNV